MDEKIDIKVDVDALYLDDLEALEGALGAKAMLDTLDRCVEGGVRGRKIPLRDLRRIARAVTAELTSDLGN